MVMVRVRVRLLWKLFAVVNWARPQLFCSRCVNVGRRIHYCGDNGSGNSHCNGAEATQIRRRKRRKKCCK